MQYAHVKCCGLGCTLAARSSCSSSRPQKQARATRVLQHADFVEEYPCLRAGVAAAAAAAANSAQNDSIWLTSCFQMGPARPPGLIDSWVVMRGATSNLAAAPRRVNRNGTAGSGSCAAVPRRTRHDRAGQRRSSQEAKAVLQQCSSAAVQQCSSGDLVM